MTLLDDALLADGRLTAFKILRRHPDCLKDDVSMNDLIDEIAEAIYRAKMNRPLKD